MDNFCRGTSRSIGLRGRSEVKKRPEILSISGIFVVDSVVAYFSERSRRLFFAFHVSAIFADVVQPVVSHRTAARRAFDHLACAFRLFFVGIENKFPVLEEKSRDISRRNERVDIGSDFFARESGLRRDIVDGIHVFRINKSENEREFFGFAELNPAHGRAVKPDNGHHYPRDEHKGVPFRSENDEQYARGQHQRRNNRNDKFFRYDRRIIFHRFS